MTPRKHRGSAAIEFALCGVPLLFMWVSIVQMSVGMWHNQTLQAATRAAGSYISVHGASFLQAGNNPVKIKDVAAVLQNSAIGLPASGITVTWSAGAATYRCVLSSCLTDSTVWPPVTANSLGTDITVQTSYTWHSALSMMTPEDGKSSEPFNAATLAGYTRQFILF